MLHAEEGPLVLRAAQEPKLGLDHPKPMIGLQRLSCFHEERRVSSHKVSRGGQSWSGGVPSPIASMSWSGVG
jgi:hypothetical protein